MNFFNLFGNNKRDSVPPPHKVIMNMKETLETLNKRERFLETRITEYKNMARSFVKTNKPAAISLLKKSKMNQKQLYSIYGQKNSIESQIIALEQGINNTSVISVMKQGKSTLEKMSKSMDPNDIGELMDDISSIMDTTLEVSDVLSSHVGPVYDDDELLAELEDDNKEEGDEEKILSDLMKDTPEVPMKKLEKEIRTTKEELPGL